jgi:hypothetical protein
VVSCGVRLSEVGFFEIRKPQVVPSVLIGGSTPHSVKKIGSPDFAQLCLLGCLSRTKVDFTVHGGCYCWGLGRDEVSARLLYFHTQDAQKGRPVRRETWGLPSALSPQRFTFNLSRFAFFNLRTARPVRESVRRWFLPRRPSWSRLLLDRSSRGILLKHASRKRRTPPVTHLRSAGGTAMIRQVL